MLLRILLAASLAGCAGSKAPSAPAPDTKRAPDFTLSDTEGQSVTLSKLLERGPVILAFFPKAFTGG
jgi:peroxiredoxin